MRARGVGLIFFLVGALMLLLSIGLATKTIFFLSHAAHATGTITDQVRIDSTDGRGHPNPTFRPTFTFQTPDSHWHVVTSKTSTSTSHTSGSQTVDTTPRIHQQMPVVYDPANPENAQLDTFAQLWLAPTILGGLGAVFTFLGVFFLLAGR